MKTKILIIVAVLIGLGVGGFFAWKNISGPEVEKEEVPSVVKAPSIEVEVYKGIWLPTSLVEDPNQIASKMQKFKDIGGNTVFIQGFPSHPEYWLEKANFPPELIKKIEEVIPIEKQLMIDNIQTAYRNGLKVALTISTPPRLEEIDLEALNSKIIEYAKLAEEYEVELFAPMNEPEIIFLEDTGRWRQEILPKIREVYHGEIIWKGGGPEGPPGDFSGYDYIGFTTLIEGPLTLEEYSQNVDNTLKHVLALAERDNSKGVMITEFGVWDWEPGHSEEEIARAHEIVLERGKDRVVGFFAMDFLGVELPGIPPIKEDLKIKEVIRKWFTEILP